MFEQPVVIYSEHCKHSELFMKELMKHPAIFKQFAHLNIDVNPQTRRRPQELYDVQNALGVRIQSVPTIVVDNGEYVLAGDEAFKWLEYAVSSSKEQDVDTFLEAFCPNEMGAFSDSYSRLGTSSLNDATDQTFKFLDKPEERIQTPQEESKMNQGTRTAPNDKQSDIDTRLQRLMAQRDQLAPPTQPHATNVDFSAGVTATINRK